MGRYIVIMAGGSGKRLWPLSRAKKPKQFLDIFGDGSFLQNTVKRAARIVPPEKIIVVGAAEQKEALLSDLSGSVPEENILLEPVGRNTSACIALAAFRIMNMGGEVMGVLPSDHYIGDEDAFCGVLSNGLDAAEKSAAIITIGITPTYPATGYGYINYGEAESAVPGAFEVKRFVEKPGRARAEAYIAEGGYLWNGGIFISRVGLMLENIRKFLPAVYEDAGATERFLARGEDTKAFEIYSRVQNIPIDFGVMEKCERITVFPGDFGWNDVGGFDSLRGIAEKDENGNAVIKGRLIQLNSKNLTVYSEKPVVAAIDVDDLIVIDTGDSLYICRRGHSERTREIVDMLSAENLKELG